MLEMTGLWDSCQGVLQTIKGPAQEREVCLMNNAEKTWKSEENLKSALTSEIENVEHGVFPAGFLCCFGPILPDNFPFPPIWNGNVHSVLCASICWICMF